MTIRALALAAAAVCLVALPCHAAFQFVETWSDVGDVEGWVSLNANLTLSHNDIGNTLAMTLTDGFDDAGPVAGVTSSGGAFVGDVSGMAGAYYGFDILVDVGSDLDNLGMGLSNAAGTERWLATVGTLPTLGQWAHYDFPLVESQWTHVLGSQSFGYVLQNLAGVAVGLSEPNPSNGIGASGQLDNFRLSVPEPGTGLLVGLGMLGLAALRRRRGER